MRAVYWPIQTKDTTGMCLVTLTCRYKFADLTLFKLTKEKEAFYFMFMLSWA